MTEASDPACRVIDVVDSHTEGEPTRVVLAGGPDLGSGTVAEKRDRFREKHDRFRTAMVKEPRGYDWLVGAILCETKHPDADFGVIFFNNVGYLGMCGHGTIGVVETLRYLGQIQPGEVRLETPVGVVASELLEDGRISVRNVESYRQSTDVTVEVSGLGEVRGDIVWEETGSF